MAVVVHQLVPRDALPVHSRLPQCSLDCFKELRTELDVILVSCIRRTEVDPSLWKQVTRGRQDGLEPLGVLVARIGGVVHIRRDASKKTISQDDDRGTRGCTVFDSLGRGDFDGRGIVVRLHKLFRELCFDSRRRNGRAIVYRITQSGGADYEVVRTRQRPLRGHPNTLEEVIIIYLSTQR